MAAILLDGFESAFLGATDVQRDHETVTAAVYDRDKMIKVLMRRDGMDYDDASEFIAFNIEGAAYGDGVSPVILERLTLDAFVARADNEDDDA